MVSTFQTKSPSNKMLRQLSRKLPVSQSIRLYASPSVRPHNHALGFAKEIAAQPQSKSVAPQFDTNHFQVSTRGLDKVLKDDSYRLVERRADMSGHEVLVFLNEKTGDEQVFDNFDSEIDLAGKMKF